MLGHSSDLKNLKNSPITLGCRIRTSYKNRSYFDKAGNRLQLQSLTKLGKLWKKLIISEVKINPNSPTHRTVNLIYCCFSCPPDWLEKKVELEFLFSLVEFLVYKVCTPCGFSVQKFTSNNATSVCPVLDGQLLSSASEIFQRGIDL